MMNPEWTMVYASNKPYEIEMVKALLEEHNIECVSMNKQDSAYLFGEIEIYVSTADAFIARQIIVKLKGE